MLNNMPRSSVTMFMRKSVSKRPSTPTKKATPPSEYKTNTMLTKAMKKKFGLV